MQLFSGIGDLGAIGRKFRDNHIDAGHGWNDSDHTWHLGLLYRVGCICEKEIPLHFMLWIGAALLLTTVTGCVGSSRYVQSNGTPPGFYSLTIVATSGAITHSSTVSLHVVAQ